MRTLRFLILGGGISALSAAWYLSRKHEKAQITLLEKNHRLGGLIETTYRDGFLFEKGPRTFKASRSPSLLQLIKEVGLENELIYSDNKANRRYLYTRGSLRSFLPLAAPHLWRLILEPFIKRGEKEETIHAFAVRRFGKKIADLFFDPITLGIFAGDCRTLSCHTCLPALVRLEKEFGSIVIGAFLAPREKKQFPGTLFTLKRGMQSLIDALQKLLPIDIHLNAEVQSLEKKEGKWIVHTQDRSWIADAVFSALPAPILSQLLPGMPQIPHASLTVINLGFSKLKLPRKGYGYLIPSSENENLLGMIWDSEVFPTQGAGRMTAMVRPCKDAKAVVIDALSRHLGVETSPDRMDHYLAVEAIPQHTVGISSQIKAWEAELSDFYLLGNYIDGVSVEHCIARSERVVQPKNGDWAEIKSPRF